MHRLQSSTTSTLLALLPATVLSLLALACGSNSATSTDSTCSGDSCEAEHGGAPNCASENDCDQAPDDQNPDSEDPDDQDPDDQDPDSENPDDQDPDSEDPDDQGLDDQDPDNEDPDDQDPDSEDPDDPDDQNPDDQNPNDPDNQNPDDQDPDSEDPDDQDPDDQDPDDQDPECEGGECDPNGSPGVCGDGTRDDDEACDAGSDNQDEWSTSPTCLTDCSAPSPSCGDGIYDPDFEACDAGEENVDSVWAVVESCGTECAYLPFCGDGIVDDGFETCDEGEDNGIPTSENGKGCGTDCQPLGSCGNGTVDEGEECDAGILAGKSAGCDANCHWVGLCNGLPTAAPGATVPSVESYPVEPNCVLPSPDASSPSCSVPEMGAVYFVSEAAGSDEASADGSLTKPWKTLRHAIAKAKAPATLRVAEGDYNAAEIALIKPLVVKGGYSSDFSSWNPDQHPSRYFGRLHLNHNDAVWGGFLMRGAVPRNSGSSTYHQSFHHLMGGSLIRNRVEIDYEVTTTTYYLYGTLAVPCAEGVVRLACNDMYVRGRTATGSLHSFSSASTIEMGNLGLPRGSVSLEGNHICQPGHRGSAVSGYGTCDPAAQVDLQVSNNLIESGAGSRSSIEFYGCGDSEMSVRLSNNTLLGSIDGYESSDDAPAPLRWYLANNILAGNGRGQCIDVADERPEFSRIEQAYNNLCVGFATNTISPAPILSEGNIESASYSLADVFVDPANGDYRIRSDGPAAGSGRNLTGWSDGPQPLHDINGNPRPSVGAWDLGAFNVSQ